MAKNPHEAKHIYNIMLSRWHSLMVCSHAVILEENDDGAVGTEQETVFCDVVVVEGLVSTIVRDVVVVDGVVGTVVCDVVVVDGVVGTVVCGVHVETSSVMFSLKQYDAFLVEGHVKLLTGTLVKSWFLSE